MKTLFTVTAVLLFTIAAAWLLFPAGMLSAWTVESNAGAIYMGRRYGGMFLGYALMLWLARDSNVPHARRPILAGVVFVAFAMASLSVLGALTHVAGLPVLGAAAIEVVLVVAFARAYGVEAQSTRHTQR